MSVAGKLLLVTLELSPVDVTFMMTLQKNFALGEGAIVAVRLASSTIDNLGAVFAFTIGVSTGVEGVLQHRNDIAVSDRHPFERDHPLAIRRARKMDAVGL